jgi:hypothetical protein
MKDEKVNEVQAEAQVATPEGGAGEIILFVDENIPELKDKTDDEKFAAVVTELKKNKLFHDKMEELFQSEPLLAQLIAGVMKDKRTFLDVMAELISPDEYAELLENEGSDVLKTRDERLGKLKEIEDKEAAYATNVESSAQQIEEFLASKDWDEAKKDDFVNKMDVFFKSFSDGVLTVNELEQIAHMFYFDEAVSQAREEGVVVGRNEQIDDKRLKEKVAKGTDGLPALAGGGNAGQADEKPAAPNPFMDVIAHRGKKIY